MCANLLKCESFEVYQGFQRSRPYRRDVRQGQTLEVDTPIQETKQEGGQ